MLNFTLITNSINEEKVKERRNVLTVCTYLFEMSGKCPNKSMKGIC